MFRCDEVIAKAREDDIAKIEILVRSVENKFKRAFLDYVNFLASDNRLAQLVRFLEAGRIDELNTFLSQTLRVYETAIFDAVTNAGKFQTNLNVDEILPKIQNIDAPVVTLTFNPGNPRAAELVQNQAGRLIREVSETQRNVVSTIIAEGQNAGQNPVAVARRIKENIGLTSRQYQAVKNYENQLRQGNKDALNRDLRDKRFDASVRNATDKPLTEDQITRMTDRYRERYVQYRSETIARTESVEAVNNGRQEAMQQNLEQVGLTENEVEKTWNNIRDTRTRPSHMHGALGGQKVIGLNTPFISTTGSRLRYPGDRSLGAGAADCVCCRCSLTYRVISP